MKRSIKITQVISIILVGFSAQAMDKKQQQKTHIAYAQLAPLASLSSAQKDKFDKDMAESQKKFLDLFRLEVDKELWSKRKQYEQLFERRFKQCKDYRPDHLSWYVRNCMLERIKSIYKKLYRKTFSQETIFLEQAQREAENYYEDKQSGCCCFGN